MTHNHESHARDLQRKLSEALGQNGSGTSFSVAPSGTVCCRCIAIRENRSCIILCFHRSDTNVPDYLVSFYRDQESCAMGLTSGRAQAELISSIKDWLDGSEASDLYDRYSFIEAQKRSLQHLAREAIAVCPELTQVTHEVRVIGPHPHRYELWFHGINRCCRVSYPGLEPCAHFHWDEYELFSFSPTDVSRFALVLKRWLCDCAAPSAMQKDFPSLQMSKAAKYHEEGRGIEGEFIVSWDQVEEVLGRATNWPPAPLVRAFVADLRKLGYDSKLRAEHNGCTLVFSRSRRQVSRKQRKPHISFHFRAQGMDVYPSNLYNRKISAPQIMLTADVEAILRELETVPID